MQAVPGEADTKGPPDESEGEGVLGEVCQQPARDHPARAAFAFPAGAPRQRRRPDQPEDLDGVAPGDREREPGRDAFTGRNAGGRWSSWSLEFSDG